MKRCAGRMHQSRMRKGSIISAPKRISSKLGTVRMRRKPPGDRKSTRLNSSHSQISYAVFCLKKKKKHTLVHAEGLGRRIAPPLHFFRRLFHPFLAALTGWAALNLRPLRVATDTAVEHDTCAA